MMRVYVFLGVVLAASLTAGLDPQPPANVWKTSNTSRPWQNPAWATSNNPSLDSPVTQKSPGLGTNSEWPSLSGSRQPTQQPNRPNPSISYSGIVSPPNQRNQNAATTPTSHRYTSQGGSNRNTQNNRGPSSPNISQNRTRITDQELTALSEKLFDDDSSNLGSNVRLNYQSRTQSNSLKDEAPEHLISVDSVVLNKPTIKALRQLYDNYIADTSFVESVTSNERQEESEFLDKVLATTVMKEAMEFLADKGFVHKNSKAYKDLLSSIWFTMYSRGGGIIGSSAFEHIFLGELKKDEVSGLHNWIYFANEEENNRADYMGYLRKLDLGKKSNLLKVHYKWSNVIKHSGSMFVGTSPELEMALYTVCFLTRPGDRCPLSFGGKTFGIQTYTYRLNRNKGTVISSAYPVF